MNDTLNDIEQLKVAINMLEGKPNTELGVKVLERMVSEKEAEVVDYEKSIDFFFNDTPFK
jgi:hypothetical protein